MIYLTSDTHFGDNEIIDCVDRPFANIDDMDEAIINNINKVVKSNDILYILGDFTVSGNYDKCMTYRERLNCRHVSLIYGNHDTHFRKQCAIANKPFIYESEQDYLEIQHKGTIFCLSHYPFISWHDREHGSIMCHGHLHSAKRINSIHQWQGIRRFDVGVDANDYTPVSIDYILDYFNEPLKF